MHYEAQKRKGKSKAKHVSGDLEARHNKRKFTVIQTLHSTKTSREKQPKLESSKEKERLRINVRHLGRTKLNSELFTACK